MVRFGHAAIALLTCILTSVSANAEQRFALVIGNQTYNEKVGPLHNPHNDIAVVGRALAEVGFNLLPPLKDASREELLLAAYKLAETARTAGRGAVSFLYYAGHGVSVGGENVLIPANAMGTSDAELTVRGVRVGEILDILTRVAPDAVHFVVLDACRTNLRGRRGARGFVPVNDRRTGIVIAFATAEGETATDDGANSAPYAAALAEELVKPGRNDQEIFNEVRRRVSGSLRNQTPWTHDGLVGERVIFRPGPAQDRLSVAPALPVQPRLNEAAFAWQLIKDTTDAQVLEGFIRKFGETDYGGYAKDRVKLLNEVKQAADAIKGAKAAQEAAKAAQEAAKAAEEVIKKKLEDNAGPVPAAFPQPAPPLLPPPLAPPTTCGWHAIGYCSQDLASAQALVANYGGYVINTNDYAKFRAGWYCIVEGPSQREAATLAMARMKSMGATTAYIKNSC